MTRLKSVSKTRILVLGGGFAGINTLMRLQHVFRKQSQVEITLVSRENYFLFTPLLSEVAVGSVDPRHIVAPIRELCHQARFHRGEVQAIDLKRQTVDILYNNVPGCLDTLRYDHLVLALGSSSNLKILPSVAQYAFPFKDIGDALQVRNHLLEMFERADVCLNPETRQAMLTFTIIGGGYSGVEIAAAIREMANRVAPLYPSIRRHEIRVVLIEAQNRILSMLPEELSYYAQEQLEDMGVALRLNTRILEVQPTWVTLDKGQKIPTYTALWTTGIAMPPLLYQLPVEKDAKNRPLNTHYLHLPGHPNVWGVGDNILTPLPDGSGFYPATAQVAVRQGRSVAENIAAVLAGKAPKVFEFKQVGEMVVLGERSAVALIYGHKIKGFPAWVLWRAFYLSKLPRWTKKVRVALDWILDLFGPIETTQIKTYARPEPCDIVSATGSQAASPQESPICKTS